MIMLVSLLHRNDILKLVSDQVTLFSFLYYSKVIHILIIQYLLVYCIQKLNLCWLNSISTAFKVFSHLPCNITLNFLSTSDNDSYLRFENVVLLFKWADDLIRINWREIKYSFDELHHDDIKFYENNIWIYRFKTMHIKNLTKEIATTSFASESSSYISFENECYLSTPQSKLKNMRFNMVTVLALLENYKNKFGFCSLPSSANVKIIITSMEEISKLEEISDYVPDHAELEFSGDIYRYKYTLII